MIRYRFESYNSQLIIEPDPEGEYIEYEVYKELEEKFEKMKEFIESNDLMDKFYDCL